MADGVGITLMARIVGVPIRHRITGHDYFTALMKALRWHGNVRIFFFGSTEKSLGLISARVVREYPEIILAGFIAPPFGDWNREQNERTLGAINAAKPHVLWAGMTAPKQETWAEVNRHRLELAVIASIGAVFDFFAGAHPQAPRWMCRLGIEWLYRLGREPRRMWRRNFVSSPAFLALAMRRHFLRGKKFTSKARCGQSAVICTKTFKLWLTSSLA